MSISAQQVGEAVPDGSVEAPFILKQGRTFDLVTITKRAGVAVDLLSPARTGRGQLRKLASDVGAPVATFTVTIRNPQTGGDRGKADVFLGATVSPLIAPGDYVADVEFPNSGDPEDVLTSDVFHVKVTPEVTK